ncbi:unnamed protein product [Gordionus sp. m RMFG-2023]|uniref:acetylcholinesterase-like n=1 Tax=Gordionus sp. m RMFG-2023 TaxID=3053472 RepID=UPI0030DF157C
MSYNLLFPLLYIISKFVYKPKLTRTYHIAYNHASFAIRYLVLLTLIFLIKDPFSLIVNSVIEDDYIVKTTKGKVQGVKQLTSTLNPVIAYLGVPYATPPLGDLRFRHPLPISPWVGTLNATKYPNSCYQIFDTLFGNFSGSQMWNPNTPLSEDCLYLNLWVPYGSDALSRPSKPMAVMVWIFGGGFYSGTSSLDVYDGRILASSNDVIVANFNYRVGSLGYLYLGRPEVAGNAGLFDQRLAMQWIHDNIAEFGGDPHRITLFGESAGASSVDMHMISPGSWRYFERAILESGTSTNYWATVTPQEAVKRGLRLAEGLDCPFKTDTLQATIECLRSADPWDIVTHDWVTTEYMKFPFVPVVDGVWFEESPQALLQKKKFKKTSVLIGTNGEEGTYFNIYQLPNLFLPLDKKVILEKSQFAKSLTDLFPQFNQIGHKAILYEYTNWEDANNNLNVLDAFDKSVGDFYFTCGVNQMAYAYAKTGINVFKYYFSHRSSQNPWPTWMGVMHADEINYIFGEPLVPGKGYKPEEIELSRNMMKFWTNFAKTGNPNINEDGKWSEIQWPLHTTQNREFLRLSVDSHDIGKGPRTKQCAFWQEFIPDLMTATEDLSDTEIQWKSQFNDWKTKYIVDWKLQFDKYVTRQNTKYENCAITNKI